VLLRESTLILLYMFSHLNNFVDLIARHFCRFQPGFFLCIKLFISLTLMVQTELQTHSIKHEFKIVKFISWDHTQRLLCFLPFTPLLFGCLLNCANVSSLVMNTHFSLTSSSKYSYMLVIFFSSACSKDVFLT